MKASIFAFFLILEAKLSVFYHWIWHWLWVFHVLSVLCWSSFLLWKGVKFCQRFYVLVEIIVLFYTLDSVNVMCFQTLSHFCISGISLTWSLVYNPFNILLNLIFWYLVEDFYTDVHEGCCSVVFGFLL